MEFLKIYYLNLSTKFIIVMDKAVFNKNKVTQEMITDVGVFIIWNILTNLLKVFKPMD